MTFSTRFSRVSAVAALTLSLSACLLNDTNAAGAADAKDGKLVTADVQKKLLVNFPNAKVVSISPTPLAGLFEVVLNKKDIVYVDREARYLFDGDMVDLKSRRSLTEARVAELSKIDFASLPLDRAIKVVKGNGSRKMVVFSDPDCPFCKRLEQQSLKDVTDVTIYTLLYPLAQLHPDAPHKSALIWCAPDRAKAWTDFMLDGKLPANDGKCDTPLAEIAELGARNGISGTPGIVFSNGKLVPGAVPREQIEAELKAAEGK
ncbi:DsbC family protein [Chitinivorax sp. PXF-14]|uniref:DsbC family protein n=1 Tax=Chitinivorax sp. PXF-14 TaxID=3230488 RepID=UPI0034679E2D